MINSLEIFYRNRNETDFIEVEVYTPDYKDKKVVSFLGKTNHITIDYKDLKSILAMVEAND